MKVQRKKFSIGFALVAVLLAMPAVLAAQEKIVFSSNREGVNNSEIYLMNTDGTDQKRLTFNTVFDGEPSFSSDGGKIVFTSTRDAMPRFMFPGIRHFVHGNLFPNTQYYYRVRAFNAGGASAHTDVVSAKTLRK